MDYILGICLLFMVAHSIFGIMDIFIQTSKIKDDDEIDKTN
jgi:hypothetical protein